MLELTSDCEDALGVIAECATLVGDSVKVVVAPGLVCVGDKLAEEVTEIVENEEV